MNCHKNVQNFRDGVLDQLERDSPDVPDDLYDQAANEQRSDDQGV